MNKLDNRVKLSSLCVRIISYLDSPLIEMDRDGETTLKE